ncbi:hypothetical protein SS50377_28111 [Spironucleus salmonicida]|uniref:EF-hand domain-containing protein n=1 Tax=Spironucleus salmonicida TaxID=348837 RepID=V6LE65_9EUKA|nr:hypothetical protein SS50377_28111 [Spironucleus salmonicida]|eukprot:EST42795.1 Hypothetical protein SS50377_17564 [Spironucleus salmonicida]
MTTPSEIREKYGFAPHLKLNKNNAQTRISEHVETVGKNKFFSQMDKNRNQKITKAAFLSQMQMLNVPINQPDAAEIFDAYSQNSEMTRQNLQKMISESRPVCSRKLEDYTVQNMQNSVNLNTKIQIKEAQLDKNDLLRLAQAQFARRCQERFKTQKDVLKLAYTQDSVVTRQSLKELVQDVIPELPEAVEILVDASCEYNTHLNHKSKIPLSGGVQGDKSIIPEVLEDQVVRQLLSSPGASNYCQRRDEDNWAQEVEKVVFKQQGSSIINQTLVPDVIKTVINEELKCQESQKYPEINLEALQPQQLSPQLNLNLKQDEINTIDHYATDAHKQNTSELIKNYFKHTTSSISFQNYGNTSNGRSNSVSYMPRKSLKQGQKEVVNQFKNIKITSPQQNIAKLAFLRCFDGRKTAAAAALIESYKRSGNKNEFRKNLSVFAPNCSVETGLFLEENSSNLKQLISSLNLEQEAEVYMNNENYLHQVENNSKLNSYKLSANNACVPLQTEVFDFQKDVQHHSRANNSSLMHEHFNTTAGEGSFKQNMKQEFPSEASIERVPGNGYTRKIPKKYDFISASKEDRSILAPPAIRDRQKSSIIGGTSNVELQTRSRSGKANFHHDIFSPKMERVRIINDKFLQSSLGSLLDESGLKW